MAKKILLGGILGGIVFFLWASFSHLVLPLGKAGIRQIPNEAAVLAAMRVAISEPGFYIFPGMAESAGMTKEQQAAAMNEWQEKYRRGPTGILIYHPQGREALSPKQLLTELGSNIVAALVIAILLAMAAPGLGGYAVRVCFVACFGLFSFLDIHVSYWNWYGFPASYTLAALVDGVVGWALAGLAMGAIVKTRNWPA